MFTACNRTVFEIPMTWDRKSFEASRTKCHQARKLVETSINAQYNKQMREVFYEKLNIEKNIDESHQRLLNQQKKMNALENLIDVAAQSLDNYFDKRMENVRAAIQEHCDAIQQILFEENEHWKEIHSAIDQNLITSDDIHPHISCADYNDQEIPSTSIHTIHEVDEEEHTSKLLNNKTVTPILTQMIRKSRIQSNRLSAVALDVCQSTEKLIQSKEERFSVIIPLTSARRTLPVIDTTFVIKHELSQTGTEPDRSYAAEVSQTTTETNQSYAAEVSQTATDLNQSDVAEVSQPATEPNQSCVAEVSQTATDPNQPDVAEVSQAATDINQSDVAEVSPMEPLPTTDVEIIPTLSQPKPPARLYFSPTLLQDNEELETIQSILSPIDQNKSNVEKLKAEPRRFGQTFLLDNIKSEKLNKTQNMENIRPNIPDETHTNRSLSIEMEPLHDSHHSDKSNEQKSMLYQKRIVQPKVQSSVHVTRQTTRKQQKANTTQQETRKQQQINVTQRETRKRKQSMSEDENLSTVALRKKKTIAKEQTKPKTRKTKVKKAKEIPIREPSPLPIIDRSKHYSTRFSTRSHRFNNLTLSTTTLSLDDETNKSKNSSKMTHTKTIGRPRKQNNDDKPNQKISSTKRLNETRSQPKTRAQSMMVTRSRRK